ncbi:MbtH family protein [Nocardia ninae]|uniref:MbtH protein n=1 Tax=Nocardia ninae NBRC 108245 TaxID=1210091 RepID=A0A511MGK7_9NOCA|nr:MbtH family protein [Nocardia ninae]GEM39784.1 MbtH protein [Nocardia ninae NBRC 108245]
MIRFDRYLVVHNEQEQYSVWPTARPLPDGWFATSVAGSRAECLAYIDEVWVDIRPKRHRAEAGPRDA